MGERLQAKLGARLRCKTKRAHFNEALCKVLAQNLYCVIQSMYELGVEPTFGQRVRLSEISAHFRLSRTKPLYPSGHPCCSSDRDINHGGAISSILYQAGHATLASCCRA